MKSGRLRRRKTAEEILTDLRHGWSDPDQRLWLRRYHPELERPFRSPCVPLFPLCGIALSVFLSTVGLGPFTWLRFLAWLLVGVIPLNGLRQLSRAGES